jgi:4-hydroxy-4-methyl-2-oxoglutarate aldolase
MMFPIQVLTKSQLDELKKFDTPSICNTIESFNVRLNTEGFMKPEIKCIIQYNEPIVGYAFTARISASGPATDEQKLLSNPYFKKISELAVPIIMVIEDMDKEPIGSYWGGVNASIHMALGCVGVITNGGVRDLEETEKIGFRYFASNVLVSHAYVHLTEIECSVNVGGLKIGPGDLLHADRHGVTMIPHEIAPELAQACLEVQEAENIVIEECQKRIGKGIDIEYLQGLRQKMYKLRDRKRGQG